LKESQLDKLLGAGRNGAIKKMTKYERKTKMEKQTIPRTNICVFTFFGITHLMMFLFLVENKICLKHFSNFELFDEFADLV